MPNPLVSDAVKAAGGPLQVAYKLKLSTENTVRKWMTTGSVPPKHVVSLCELGGGKFKPEQIRPDVFAGASA